MSDKKKLLLVDNEESILEAVSTLLSSMDYDVVTAASGQEAVDRFKEDPDCIACAIVDLAMPVMDGIATVRNLRAIRDSLAVILATGYSDICVPDEFLQACRTKLVKKPYRGKVIDELIKSFRQPAE